MYFSFLYCYKYYAIYVAARLVLFSENKYMSNSYFKFKQFTVYHDKCAMKVGTDGVLLGGWADITAANLILDIGTGTGLIAMMLSQRCDQKNIIDAIDIDENAVIQAKENVDRAGFTNIICHRASLSNYVLLNRKKYDLIVSNPPYFISSLQSTDKQRTTARHTESLPIADLFRLSASMLSKDGRFVIVFPYQDKELLLSLANKYGLFPKHITNVRPTPLSEYKRILIEFSNVECMLSEDDIVIEVDRHIYTSEFRSMLKDFYLKF